MTAMSDFDQLLESVLDERGPHGSAPEAIGRCAFNGCRRSVSRSATSFTR